MSLTIKRAKDNRVVKCILHRIADIPGGVTVKTANLGGTALFEGTPIGKGKDGVFEVCKTAQIVTKAEANATTYEVAKGHHFKVGDRFALMRAMVKPSPPLTRAMPPRTSSPLAQPLARLLMPELARLNQAVQTRR